MPKSFIQTNKTPTLTELSTPLGRFYVTEDGKKYPSVTNVLGDYSKEAIDKWKARIGEAAAQKEIDYAVQRGTQVHNLIESYMLGDISNLDTYMPIVRTMFRNLQQRLDLIDNIHVMEKTLVSNVLGVAGRVDLIAEYDGTLSIIDFKTSKKSKKVEWMKKHFMQTAAYAFMYHEMTGILPKQLVIMAAGEDLSTQVFLDNPGNHIRDFKKEVDRFYKNMLD